MENFPSVSPSQTKPKDAFHADDPNPKMPHAVSEDDNDEGKRLSDADDEIIAQLLAGSGQANDALAGLNDDFENEPGEKADDALDYGDISDDDLPDEEDAAPSLSNGHASHALENEGSGDFLDDGDLFGDPDMEKDLFGGDGDMEITDPAKPDHQINGDSAQDTQKMETFEDDLFGEAEDLPSEEPATAKSVAPDSDDDEDMDPAAREQARLFKESREREDRLRRGGLDPSAIVVPVSASHQDTIDAYFPDYNKEEMPDFSKLFFRRRAHYLRKAPLKQPAKVQPTRANIEIEADQERSFKLSNGSQTRKRINEEATDDGLLFIHYNDRADRLNDHQIEMVPLEDDEKIGGVSVQDLRVLCEDWDSLSVKEVDSDHELTSTVDIFMGNGITEPPMKKRRTSLDGLFESINRDEFPVLDDPEELTAKLAKQVPLDLNDSRLLLDFAQPSIHRLTTQSSFGRRREAGGVSSAIHKKFNFSNDEEYERLIKENSIRGAVGNIPIEHSGPARRLQYPFYKTQMSLREQRNFHRPSLHFPPNSRIIVDRRLEHRKVKDMRKQTIQQTFAESKDLTFADNSSMLLLEYSEEMPLMMSNFGMNSRIINYYRRKDENDKFRPKEDIGEPRVLQEKDQSPFVKFGFVDPGQTVPTVHNNLYRAPIFRHEPRQTDFLVVRRQTGVYGTNYHLRNIENLHVVGQQFPFAEVPGTHGRKVTSTQKARMKMIAFRIYAKKLKTRSRQPYVPHSVITMHFPGSDVAQNRSKMRELMQYNKDHGTWEPKPGDEKFLDMDYLRNEIKPEDICLIDSMQIGARQMQDAGFDIKQIENDKDDAGENLSLDAQLVHWRATKNFLAACGDNAMIALHGEGDPTGRGEAFSFVKISMKGGFQALGASANDKVKSAQKADQSGHKYNVRDQEDAYHAAIRHIWDAQTRSLSMTEAPDLDVEMDDNIDARIERNNTAATYGRTPRSEAPGTPGYFPRASDIDDSVSHISGSRVSASDRQLFGASERVLKVTRRRRDQYGEWITETQIIDDPVVARQYKKKHDIKHKEKLEQQIREGGAGGSSGAGGLTAEERKAAEEELARLQRNMDRRKVREAQKAAKAAIKEGNISLDGENKVLPGQTQRKCANCGQYGHIKTNKKLCPMLNGTWPDGVPPGADGGMGIGTPATPAAGSEAPTPGAERPIPRMSTSFQF
ncbi:uncharacterized protein PV09_08120 [Verruconis gallopava]|uniref:Transcription initiation factor TFIID subunit 1 histone acetyltransferase domain-containing protein n=1 Tax=Verruconis gallopava TaxID=253628 RepID=A0A0D2A264_9PEZI|nr:uncharacterized protein PV09_08120 [Verruconis gallopava]KIW00415.1 hypothetical protein PV09_08120 [Verruconis gallopava]